MQDKTNRKFGGLVHIKSHFSLPVIQLFLDNLNSYHTAIQWPQFSLSWAKEESPVCLKSLQASTWPGSAEGVLCHSRALLGVGRNRQCGSVEEGKEGRTKLHRRNTWMLKEHQHHHFAFWQLLWNAASQTCKSESIHAQVPLAVPMCAEFGEAVLVLEAPGGTLHWAEEHSQRITSW